MAREGRFDISLKNIGSNLKLSIGTFPDEFTANKEKCTLDIQGDNIIATEEVPKLKKTIKLGKVVEENLGTKINQFKGQPQGGQSGRHILFVYEDKQFRAYPIGGWYDFK